MILAMLKVVDWILDKIINYLRGEEKL